MNWTLEVIPVPVTDMDRAKEFYADKVGFTVDLDDEVAPGMRVVQMTPPGSRCSIAMLQGMPSAPGMEEMAPGTLQGLQVCVTDIEAAREELVARGVDVSPVRHVGATGWEDGKGDTWNSFMSFNDPDGNGWVVQEAPSELSAR
ncbi:MULTISPECIES: VOC family protein [Streptomyces]|uniref:Enzyme related to lactoylglutathione lyase n=1 Tax=Streptomyces clavifer TaxID=68188 RepID=A0ABS4VIL1_9ACTN|nr:MULTISPECIES: VOC family protein [Streptomyces]KQZ19944.1 glyoxalase [Streptomyces sp. Root55]MBP2363748.1 putative enzyme related to lactoylglutathione lyase [Streptomyces clavifer]MDX2747278.1 VOC family protein [Streptomyces sp. NRRL_B-2557]MDX3067367.1 VOC family protein [Streptomyces sp. ND04-05B]RPK86159.1 Glyoxalase-like domain protein [Streptomyces sp. ADI97-07]